MAPKNKNTSKFTVECQRRHELYRLWDKYVHYVLPTTFILYTDSEFKRDRVALGARSPQRLLRHYRRLHPRVRLLTYLLPRESS